MVFALFSCHFLTHANLFSSSFQTFRGEEPLKTLRPALESVLPALGINNNNHGANDPDHHRPPPREDLPEQPAVANV